MRFTLRRADGPRGMSWTAKPQVTYHKLRLYTFINDTGHSVTGNGVAGLPPPGLTESGAQTWSGRGDHGAAVAPPVA